MRDVINPTLEPMAQKQTRAQVLNATETFAAFDEWIQLISSNPQQATGGINLINNSGGTSLILASGEPFFVSGAQKYTMNTGAGAILIRAPRREMLTSFGARDFAANGASFGEPYDFAGSAGFLTVATDWLYLGADYQWRQALIGTLPQGTPFGWESADKNAAGRYYSVAWDFTVDVGAPSIFIVHDIDGVVKPSAQIGGTGTPNRGLARIGDALFAFTGSAAFARQQELGSGKWTIAVQNNVNATFTFNRLSVIRQGF